MLDADRTLLITQLREHVCADDEERRFRDDILAFVERHGNPFDRSIDEGHLTASAFITDGHGRVLLTHHRKLGLWLQLGGHADGESRGHEVALREAREESGLDVLTFHPSLVDASGMPRLLDVDVHLIPARQDEPEHDHLDLRYWLTCEHPEAIEPDFQETHALEWVTFAEALARGDRGMERAIEKILRRQGTQHR